MCKQHCVRAVGKRRLGEPLKVNYGASFVKILYLTDLAQKVLSLRIYSYLCTDLIISA